MNFVMEKRVNILNAYIGKLKIDVASEGKYIPAGTEVVVEEQSDNFKNLSVFVKSMKTDVRLPFYDTDIDQLITHFAPNI